jgi:Protein of unknown function (DUF2946)
MRWFRDHVRHGSWLALVALAINFAVAFGHVHALDGSVSERGPTAITAAASGDQPQHHPADGEADYLCPICMAAAAMGTALAPAPPALPVAFTTSAVDHAIEQDFGIARPQRAAFRPRGPPIS